jgi:hypothetical protein
VSLAVPDDNLTARQRAALESLAASHPRPRSSAQLAAELDIAEGTLNVTLGSLRRAGLLPDGGLLKLSISGPRRSWPRGHPGHAAALPPSVQGPVRVQNSALLAAAAAAHVRVEVPHGLL